MIKINTSTIIKFIKTNKMVFICYGIVFFIILGCYIALGIYPFGDLSIIKIDCFHSYAPTMLELKDKLLSGGNITFSWNGGLGIVLLHNLMQMAMSPFVLIVFLLPSKFINEAIALIVLLKTPFIAVTFYIYGRFHFKKENVVLVLFSVMYALSAFVTAYYWNTMWLDALILLPLLVMSLERLVNYGKSNMYLIVLAMGIITNYLMGFFLCGFSVIYFIALLFLEKKDWHVRKKAISQFATRSLIAGGLCAALLLPTALNLAVTGYLKDPLPSPVAFNYPLLKYVASHFWGIKPTVMSYSSKDAPNIFCGIMTMLLIPVYYFNKGIKRREKIAYSAMLLVLFLGFNVNLVDFIFNGLHFASNMPHRFSFIYVFLLLVMAYKAFVNIESGKIKVLLLSLPVYIGIVITLFIVYPASFKLKPAQMSPGMLAVNILLIVIYALILLIYIKKPSTRRVLPFLMAIIVVAEMSVSAFRNFSYANDMDRDENVYKYYDDMAKVSDRVSEETAFYRTDFKHIGSMSDARIYDYHGVGTFSTSPYALTQFLDAIGVSAGSNAIRLYNPTPFVSSILNVKYLLNRNTPMPDNFSIYQFLEQYGSIYLYENPYVLPIGFVTNPEVLKWDIGSSADVYEVQNNLAKDMTGADDVLFERVDFASFDFELLNITPTGKYQDFLVEIDEDIEPEMVPTITLTFAPEKEGFMNIHLRTAMATWATVWVNDLNLLGQAYDAPATSLDAGWVKPGDIIKVIIKMNKKEIDDEEEFIRFGEIALHASVMDQTNYEKTIAKLGEQPLKVTFFDDLTVVGTVDVKEEGILFTSIPYDPGWKVYINGKEKSTQIIGTALMGVRVDEGVHNIEFRYRMEGLTLGIIISLICLLLTAFLIAKPYFMVGKEEQADIQAGDESLC